MTQLKVIDHNNGSIILEQFYNDRDRAIKFALMHIKQLPNRYDPFERSSTESILRSEGEYCVTLWGSYGMFRMIKYYIIKIKTED